MDLILDTHSFLWFIDGNPRLSSHARILIEEVGNKKMVSKASLWEMAIKIKKGSLTISFPFGDLVADQLEPNGFEILDLRFPHFVVVSSLPLHHKDPFDRLLVAQAMIEGSPIVSADVKFDDYPVTRLW
jgi:PIN domain nuclease of toxin-antitoxin system